MNQTQTLFTEIRRPDRLSSPETSFCEVYVAVNVKPKDCGALCKRIKRVLPQSTNLSHLKRVNRTGDFTEKRERIPSSNDDDNPSKRQKMDGSQISLRLEVILGTVAEINKNFHSDEEIKTAFEVSLISMKRVGAQSPSSKIEYDTYNELWPTHFFPHRTMEFNEKKLEISQTECEQMIKGMNQAINDWEGKSYPNGVVIVKPESGQVMATSSTERAAQPTSNGPLVTPIILAIQGVSRREREHAIQKGMNHEDFQRGQYLCTHLDCYTTMEPNAFEAMALVHARIRRVVFGIPRSGNSGGLTSLLIHDLPGANHRYRAFRCTDNSDLASRCDQLQRSITADYSMKSTGQ